MGAAVAVRSEVKDLDAGCWDRGIESRFSVTVRTVGFWQDNFPSPATNYVTY